MKLVTLCSQGLSRSVTAKWLLQFRDHEVLAAGSDSLSQDTLQMLYAWADRVIVLDKALLPDAEVPASKLLLWDVGPDRFHVKHEAKFNPELVGILRGYLANTPDL